MRAPNKKRRPLSKRKPKNHWEKEKTKRGESWADRGPVNREDISRNNTNEKPRVRKSKNEDKNVLLKKLGKQKRTFTYQETIRKARQVLLRVKPGEGKVIKGPQETRQKKSFPKNGEKLKIKGTGRGKESKMTN